MGPFPHDTPACEISEENPAGTNGFEFVEFADTEDGRLKETFEKMGFTEVAKHKNMNITLWKQGDIIYVLNAEPNSFGGRFVKEHGPSAPSMAWRVVDADHAFTHAISKGAVAFEGQGKVIDVPAIKGIGDSLIYFVDQYGEGKSAYDDYNWFGEKNPAGMGFYYLDHLTNNVFRGNMDKWFGFYADIFNFKQIRFFDIEGKHTGLFSRALTSPCQRIRIPINESRDDVSQIEEYLKRYNGEGIQHIAIGTEDIYAATDNIAANGMRFMPKPPQSYYERSDKRLPGHGEPLDELAKHGILIDGEGVVDGGETKILLQIFSKTVIGPIFFEFIQRKGDDGFGEGNFRALFESIEADQVARGVI
jgi:4-hydroxyphenylpyruvate dioxygenase